MVSRSLVRGLVFVTIALALAPLAGCRDGGKGPSTPEPWGVPQSSPQNVLRNLRQAYVERNLEEYAKLFDPGFIFKFAPVDVEDGLPASWDLVSELACADSIFTSGGVLGVHLSYSASEPVPATETDELPGGPAGISKVVVFGVHLEVETRWPEGENLIYLVDGDAHEFFLRAEPEERARDGQPLWRIVYWKDKATGEGFRPATQNRSWGRIKTLFN